MTSNPHRVVAGFAVMLGVWIAVYWLYEPSEPPITFSASAPPAAALDPTPVAITPAPPPLTPAPPEPAPKSNQVVEVPKFRDYVVQAGDTSFEEISRKVFGTPRHANAISRANPFVTPNKLIVGRTRLNIPLDPTNVQGRVIDRPAPGTPEPATPAPTAKPEPPAPKPAAKPERTYVVQPGDTLSEIAQKMYGASARWRDIAAANKDRLPDPARLRTGLTLRIPE